VNLDVGQLDAIFFSTLMVDTAFGSTSYGFALFFAAATMVRTSDHVRDWAASTASMSARGLLISQSNIWAVWPSRRMIILPQRRSRSRA
jgi:hypothetical protein